MKKIKYNLKTFLYFVPRLNNKYYISISRDEVYIDGNRYAADRRAYFKEHWFLYLIARILRRKEVM